MGTNVKIDTFPAVSSSRVSLLVTGTRSSASITTTDPGYSDVVPTSEKTGQTWKYTTTAPAGNWNTNGFDDNGWAAGSGEFGVADAQRANVRTTWNTPDIWLRKTFNPSVLSAADLDALKLKVDHDEDVEIYINGMLAGSAPGYTPYTYVYLDLSAAAKSALISNSNNLIAVHCHQTTGGQIVDVGIVKQVLDGAGATNTCPQINEFDVYREFRTITTSVGVGGTISPTGVVTVYSGDSQTFTITPNSGYAVDQVLVDGTNNPAAVAGGCTLSAASLRITPLPPDSGWPFRPTPYPARSWSLPATD